MTYDTELSPEEEKQFQSWKADHAPDDSGKDYDFRGAFKAGITPSKNGHWPDTYKKPNHPTFSDESIYAQDAPRKAGHWLGSVYVPTGFASGGAVDVGSNMYAPPISAPAPPTPPVAPDPYTQNVMSYADKVKQLLAQHSATAAPVSVGAPTTGALPGTPPANPDQDNMTINARSGEYVFPEPAVKYYGVKKLETMVQKAIEDINPPGQPPQPAPPAAQTYARGGLINRKHFLKVPGGHAYDKMTPKKNPLKMAAMPTGMPPTPPDAMPAPPSPMPQDMLPNIPPATPQMGPPTQPTQPPLPHYWGGGMVWGNPDYWRGRNWESVFDQGGPQVMFPGYQPRTWNPNAFPPDLGPAYQQPDVNIQGGNRGTPPKIGKAEGGYIGNDPIGMQPFGGFPGYAGGGEINRNLWRYNMEGPGLASNSIYGGRIFGGPTAAWAGGQPGFPWSPTMLPTTYNPQGYPRGLLPNLPVNTDAPMQSVVTRGVPHKSGS